MGNLALNLLSGLVGALVGAFAGIYAVRHSHLLQAEATLRNLLVAQRVAIRMLGTIETQKIARKRFSGNLSGISESAKRCRVEKA